MLGLAGVVVEAAFVSGEHPSGSAYLAGLDLDYELALHEPGLVGFAFAAPAGSPRNSSSSGESHCAIVLRTLERTEVDSEVLLFRAEKPAGCVLVC